MVRIEKNTSTVHYNSEVWPKTGLVQPSPAQPGPWKTAELLLEYHATSVCHIINTRTLNTVPMLPI